MKNTCTKHPENLPTKSHPQEKKHIPFLYGTQLGRSVPISPFCLPFFGLPGSPHSQGGSNLRVMAMQPGSHGTHLNQPEESGGSSWKDCSRNGAVRLQSHQKKREQNPWHDWFIGFPLNIHFNLVPLLKILTFSRLHHVTCQSTQKVKWPLLFLGNIQDLLLPQWLGKPVIATSRDFPWRFLRSGFRDPKIVVAYEMIPNIPPPRNNGLIRPYCWWKKSCTSWYGKYPVIYMVLYIPGGAGFLPSTALKETLVVNNSIFLHPCCLVGVVL